MDSINKLPDYSRLEQLARALWCQPGGGPGAALMIGAGFSRMCDRITPESAEPPLWSELRDRLSDRLSSGIGSGTSDPLRIAEEFKAYFGQSALDDFIRSNVPDTQWVPGQAHKDVVELPWSNIMTTNWDTLLERAGRRCRAYNYAPVLRGADLAHTKPPRIIKLHGTVGEGGRYVFTEEDYRRYATDNAALVNAARQVFIENEVCLLGFSGDDPNFLQWTGWVRDQLGSATRRIYLVGALSLSAAARKLLEQRNVAVIDFSPLVAEETSGNRHAKATELFLNYLRAAKTPPLHGWEPFTVVPLEVGADLQVDKNTSNQPGRMRTLVERLKNERLNYPGWMTPSNRLALSLRQQVSSILGCIYTAIKDASWPDSETLTALKIELAWRIYTGFATLDARTSRILENAWDAAQHSTGAQGATRLIAPLLLRQARENGQGPAFRLWCARLKSAGDPDSIACEAFERALQARDREDWPAVESALASVSGPDPAWSIRRAGLLFELGREGDAVLILEQTLETIRDRMADARGSIWLRSRRAWCQWLLYYAHMADAESPHRHYLAELREESPFLSNPSDHFRDFSQSVEEAALRLRAQGEGMIAGFLPGSFQLVDEPAAVLDEPNTPGDIFDRFRNTAGIPRRTGEINLLGTIGLSAYLTRRPGRLSFASLWPYLNSSKVPMELERLISRTVIALFSSRQARLLKRRLTNTLAFWNRRVDDDQQWWMGRTDAVRGVMKLLGRLTPRLADGDLLECWDLCLTITADTRIPLHLLRESAEELARLCADALTDESKKRLALSAALQPYAGERDCNHLSTHDAPLNFYVLLKCAPRPEERGEDSTAWSRRVDQLIEDLSSQHGRAGAAHLLVQMQMDGALTVDEALRASKGFWRHRSDAGLPALTRIVPGAFINFPVPADVNLKRLLTGALFPAGKLPLKDSAYLTSIRYASGQLPIISLTIAHARSALPQVIDQVASYSSGNPFMLLPSEAHVRRTMGQAMGRIIVPGLKRPRQQDLVHVFRAIEELDMVQAIEGLPSLMHYGEFAGRAESIHLIQINLMSSKWQNVSASCDAVSWWFTGSARTRKARLRAYPAEITTSILAALNAHQAEGANFLIALIGDLIDAELIGSRERKRLAGTLADVLRFNDYRNIDPLSRRAVGVSLVRRACASTARKLYAAEPSAALLDSLRALTVDPLPEVRAAARS